MTIEITAQAVKEAYEKMKLTPARKEWGDPGKNCACGISALYASMTSVEEMYEKIENDIAGRNLPRFMAAQFNVSPEFIVGFTMGFDGANLPNPGEETRGYEVGKAAAQLMFGDEEEERE